VAGIPAVCLAAAGRPALHQGPSACLAVQGQSTLASLAVQGQSTLARQSDESLEKQLAALEQQIQALEKQIATLRSKQAPLLAEQHARAAKRWEKEARKHFARVEIQGTLKKASRADTLPLGLTGVGYPASSRWQVVVNKQSWEVRFPEKDKQILAAADKLLNKSVLITGEGSYQIHQAPPVPSNIPYTPGVVPGYWPPPVYLFSVSVASLRPAVRTARSANDRQLQQNMETLRSRIVAISRKGDDMTVREANELLQLRETLDRLSKEWEARLEYAEVHFRGKLETSEPDGWAIQAGSLGSWRLDFGKKTELKAIAREKQGKRVDITGVITADIQGYPTVTVESLHGAEE
jgi:hypothetical protein